MTLDSSQKTVFILTFLSMVAAHASRETWFMIKPHLALDLGLSSTFLGMIDSVFLFSYGLGYYASGVLGDRYGLVKVLTFGMWMSSCLYFLTAIIGYFHFFWKWNYVIIWALQGPAQGCILTITVTLMSNWFARTQKGSIMTIWGCNASVGNIVGQWLVILVVVVLGMYWRWVMMFAGFIVGVVSTFIYFFITDLPIDSTNIESPLIEEKKHEKLTFWDAWKIDGVAFCAFSYAGVKLLNYSFLMWLPYYLVLEHSLPLEIVSVFATLYDLGGILASVVTGVLTSITGKKTIVVLGMLGCSLPMLICFKMITSIWMLYIIIPSLGLLLAGTANIISASISADLAVSSNSQCSKATIVGVINGTGSLGAAFGQILIGYLQEYSWEYVFLFQMGTCIVSTILLLPISFREYSKAKVDKV